MLELWGVEIPTFIDKAHRLYNSLFLLTSREASSPRPMACDPKHLAYPPLCNEVAAHQYTVLQVSSTIAVGFWLPLDSF